LIGKIKIINRKPSPPWRGELENYKNINNQGWVLMKRKIIPYNPILNELSKKLRQNMTYSEVKLWNELKNGQMMGYDFDRQRPIGNFIVDFYCKDLQLALEIDGVTHLDEKVILKDEIRQSELESSGVSFLRFDALLVVNKVESVIKEIEKWILDYEEKQGVSEIVKRKRMKMENPVSRIRK
jgi:very-short-patch-repair endonuclease